MLVPFILGIILIVCFFVWEVRFARYPMVPPRVFSRASRTMTCTLLITFLSGANFFNVLLFWPTEIYNVYGNDPIQIGIRSLPVGFGILGGAVISLVCIPITRGRVREIMMFFTALMTAGTAAVCTATPDNISSTYAAISLACIGVGGVIIPVTIIAQICCPDDLIATITAITLSIRYVGGAIGYCIYYSVLYKKLFADIFQHIGVEMIVYNFGYVEGVSNNTIYYVDRLARSIAQAQYADFERFSLGAFNTEPVQVRNPNLTLAEFRYQITNATQWAMSRAYRWPYWISIAFGTSCFFLACLLGNLAPFLDEHIAVVI